MPIVEVEGQQFDFPEGTTDEVIGESIRSHFGTQEDQTPPVSQPQETSHIGRATSHAGQAVLEVPGGAALTEFTSAVNRGTVNLLDFIGPDQINNVLQLMGSESRVPTLGEQPIVQEATGGNFMEPGLARKAIRTGGEFVGPSGAIGSTIRAAASQIPKIAPAAATVLQRVTQAAASPALPEAATASIAGAGSEVGAEVGEFIGGKKGAQAGRLAGGILFPIGAVLAKESAKLLVSPSAKKLLKEAAPTIKGLKDTAKGVFKEIDNLGVTINPSSISRLGSGLRSLVRKQGYDPKSQREVANVLSRFDDLVGQNLPLSEFNIIRKAASNAALSLKPDEARLGTIMVNRMDDFLDGLNKANFSGAFNKNIAAKFRDARQLWRRAKKSEQIDEAWKSAELSPAGFENGIRQQFRSILKSKKKRKGFTPDELKAMRGVVEGTTLRNFSEKLGMLGIDEKRVSGALMPLAGSITGGAVFSGPGAIAVPIIGTLSKKLGLRLSQNAARGADLIVRAGKNGVDVAKAYLKVTPPKDRTAQELTELLLRPDISLEGLKQAVKGLPKEQKRLINDAAFLVNAIKAAQEEDK